MRAIFRRGRRLNEACIRDPTLTQYQIDLVKVVADELENRLSENVLFKEMPEIEDRRFVRRAVDELQTNEIPSSMILQQEVFHLRGAHVVDDLQQMNAQHEFVVTRLAVAAAMNEVARTNQLKQRRRRNKGLKTFSHTFGFCLARFVLKINIIDRG